MKLFLLIVLLLTLQSIAQADTQLVFKADSSSQMQSLSYLVKNSKLRLDDGNKQRFNLFDSQKQQFISANLRTGNISRIDQHILAQRLVQLNKKRLNRLALIVKEMDKKRQTLSDKELEIAEALINQLRYPEQYGAHTENKIEIEATTKNIAGIECQQYVIKQKNRRLKEVCIANRQQLGISVRDFNTLLAYEAFNYQVESQIMLAMGEADFNLVSLKENDINGVVIERINYPENKAAQRLSLINISTKPIKESLFLLPKIKKLN